MYRLLILIVLFAIGCGGGNDADQNKASGESNEEYLDALLVEISSRDKITVEQAESLSKAWNLELKAKSSITDKQNNILEEKRDLNARWGRLIEEDRVEWLGLDGLTSITDEQAESLSKVGSPIDLCGLTALSDEQAKSLSRLKGLVLDGLTTITDDQAESLSKVKGPLFLNGLTSITDEQAESLSKIEQTDIDYDVEDLHLNGLTSITDKQAKSLAKVDSLEISKACQKLIDKYKKQ